MILREHYVETASGGLNGELSRLEYTATAIPDASTLAALLQAEGVLFTVTTSLGQTYSNLHKESIELTGLPGGTGTVGVRIVYLQTLGDLQAIGTVPVVSVTPAGSHSGAAGSDTAPASIFLPLTAHHWTLKITRAASTPLAELRCVGLCANDETTRASLLSGLRETVGPVATPQFGTLDGMMKSEVRFDPAGLDPASTGSPLLRVTLVWKRLTYSPADADDFPLVEIHHTTGLTPGSCTLSNIAVGTSPSLPYAIGAPLSWNGLFTGRVVQIDRHAGSSGLQTASVTALDPRWEMAGTPIGSPPLNASSDAADAYAQRGYEWVFNRRGHPDKNTASPRFLDGDGAIYWTYGDILTLVASAYLPATLSSQPSWSTLPGAASVPGEIDLRGRDLASAVDFLLSRIGHTWTIRYGSGADLYAFKDADSTVSIPLSAVTSDTATASMARTAETIQDLCDAIDVVSAPALCQCGFAYQGTGGFGSFAPLTCLTSRDADYVLEYRPDFSGVSTAFSFLPARTGSTAYRLHHALAVRLDPTTSSGYAPATAEGAVPTGRDTVPATACFWVSWDDAGSDWRRVVGGVKIGLAPAAIFLRRRITVYAKNASAEAPRTIAVSPADHATFRLACTLAFESDYRVTASSTTGASVTTGRRRTVPQARLAPAYAANWVGDAFDSTNLNGYQVLSGSETLIPVAGRLQAIASAIAAGQGGDKVSGEARLDYWPSGIAVGKGLAISGLLAGSDGIVTAVTFRRGGNSSSGTTQTCRIEASGLALSDAQGRINPVVAARNHYRSQLPALL